MSAILKENLQNPNLDNLEQSATLLINDKVRNMKAAGERVFNMGLGQSPFPVPQHVTDALKHHAHEKDYLSVKGLPLLREEVANFHRRNDEVEIRSDQVMIGPGSKELLFLLQLCFHGEILVPSPCWVSYIPQAKILNKKISLVHTKFEDRWRITPAKLQEVCDHLVDKDRSAILILNYPGNPDGMTYTSEELKEISEVARQNNLIILSDEIYGQLNHNAEHYSIAKYYPEGTIVSGGISKWCGAGGWRVGTFTFPDDLKWLKEAMAVVASETYTSVSAPVQFAAIQAFKGGSLMEEYLMHCRRILATLGEKTYRQLHDTGLNVHPPEGGFYHFVDFSPFKEQLAKKGIHDSTQLCETLLNETGVAALPGSAFARKKNELTVRFAYVDFDGAKAITGSQLHPLHQPLPEEFTTKYCISPVKATEAIRDWVLK